MQPDFFSPTDEQLCALGKRLLDTLREDGRTLGTAESLTCGLIAATLGNISGASRVLRGGVVSYQSEIKHLLLGVSRDYTDTDNVVNEPTARQMVLGALDALQCDFAISATGYAGPTGGDAENPVGTVFIGTGTREGVTVRRYQLTGDRLTVRRKTVLAALKQALETLALQEKQENPQTEKHGGIRIRC